MKITRTLLMLPLLLLVCIPLSSRSKNTVVKEKPAWLRWMPQSLISNSIYVHNNSGTGCITRIYGLDGYTFPAPLCDGGADEGTFTGYNNFWQLEVEVNGYGYTYVDFYVDGQLADSRVVYGYGWMSFDLANTWNKGLAIFYY